MKYCFLVCTFIFSLHAYSQPMSDSVFRIVGYYSLQSAMKEKISNVAFDKLTHINLYFLNPDSNGVFKNNYHELIPFVISAHKKNVKVLVSIAGGGIHSYYAKLLKDSNRKKKTCLRSFPNHFDTTLTSCSLCFLLRVTETC